jgi:hypothetical protein
LPEKIGVDIVEPRDDPTSPGSSVGVTGISPRAAIGPHTEWRDASSCASGTRVAHAPQRSFLFGQEQIGVRHLGPQHRDGNSQPLGELGRRVRIPERGERLADRISPTTLSPLVA